MAELRILIDFANGENWEIPPHLYEDYLRVCDDLLLSLPDGLTCIQYWLSRLPADQIALVR